MEIRKAMEETVFRCFSDKDHLFSAFFDNYGGFTILEKERPNRILAFNKAFARMTGYSREELFKKPYLDFIQPDAEVVLMNAIGSAVQGENKTYGVFQKRLIGKNGLFIWVATFVWITKQEFVVVRDMDITHQKMLEAELLNSNDMVKDRLPDYIRGRQRDVARLVAAGFTSKEIADRLNISPPTVDNYRAKIRRFLVVPKEESLSFFLSRFRI